MEDFRRALGIWGTLAILAGCGATVTVNTRTTKQNLDARAGDSGDPTPVAQPAVSGESLESDGQAADGDRSPEVHSSPNARATAVDGPSMNRSSSGEGPTSRRMAPGVSADDVSVDHEAPGEADGAALEEPPPGDELGTDPHADAEGYEQLENDLATTGDSYESGARRDGEEGEEGDAYANLPMSEESEPSDRQGIEPSVDQDPAHTEAGPMSEDPESLGHGGVGPIADHDPVANEPHPGSNGIRDEGEAVTEPMPRVNPPPPATLLEAPRKPADYEPQTLWWADDSVPLDLPGAPDLESGPVKGSRWLPRAPDEPETFLVPVPKELAPTAVHLYLRQYNRGTVQGFSWHRDDQTVATGAWASHGCPSRSFGCWRTLSVPEPLPDHLRLTYPPGTAYYVTEVGWQASRPLPDLRPPETLAFDPATRILTWSAVEGANRYQIMRRSNSGPWEKLSEPRSKDSSWFDKTVDLSETIVEYRIGVTTYPDQGMQLSHVIGPFGQHPAPRLPQELRFRDEDYRSDFLGGAISLLPAPDQRLIDHYVLYWGRDAASKASTVPIVRIPAQEAHLAWPLPAGTSRPAQTTHFLAYSEANGIESDRATALPVLDLASGSIQSVSLKAPKAPLGRVTGGYTMKLLPMAQHALLGFVVEGADHGCHIPCVGYSTFDERLVRWDDGSLVDTQGASPWFNSPHGNRFGETPASRGPHLLAGASRSYALIPGYEFVPGNPAQPHVNYPWRLFRDTTATWVDVPKQGLPPKQWVGQRNSRSDNPGKYEVFPLGELFLVIDQKDPLKSSWLNPEDGTWSAINPEANLGAGTLAVVDYSSTDVHFCYSGPPLPGHLEAHAAAVAAFEADPAAQQAFQQALQNYHRELDAYEQRAAAYDDGELNDEAQKVLARIQERLAKAPQRRNWTPSPAYVREQVVGEKPRAPDDVRDPPTSGEALVRVTAPGHWKVLDLTCPSWGWSEPRDIDTTCADGDFEETRHSEDYYADWRFSTESADCVIYGPMGDVGQGVVVSISDLFSAVGLTPPDGSTYRGVYIKTSPHGWFFVDRRDNRIHLHRVTRP